VLLQHLAGPLVNFTKGIGFKPACALKAKAEAANAAE
jgi:hypothetical protein